MFKILNANGIETPKYAVVDRVKDKDVKGNHEMYQCRLALAIAYCCCDMCMHCTYVCIYIYMYYVFSVVVNEADDMLEIDGTVFHKPFVEKPVSAEDHNIYIYFPSDFGGGSQRLFRKASECTQCGTGYTC